MKLKEIILFLLILSFVMNGLTALRITQTSYGNEMDDVSSLETVEAKLIAHIAITIIAGIATAVAVSALSVGVVKGDRIFAYGLLGGILSTTLIGGVSMLSNIHKALPVAATTGYVIVIAIFISVLVVLISWVYIEAILGVKLD